MALRFQKTFRPSSLDYPLHTLNNSSKSCVRKFAYRLVKHAEGTTVKRQRIFCNSWRCIYCGPKKAERLRENIIGLSEKYGLGRMFTLTLRGDSKPFHPSSFRKLRNVWDTFREDMRKHYGARFVYIWVLGIGESGRVHMHVLVNAFIDQKILAATWQQSGGGIVDIKRVYNIAIIADYMACNLLSLSIPMKTRRFGCPRALSLHLEPMKGQWETVSGMTSLMQLPENFKIVHAEEDSQGTPVYCIAREPYYRSDRHED
jgi:hypothetical protein